MFKIGDRVIRVMKHFKGYEFTGIVNVTYVDDEYIKVNNSNTYYIAKYFEIVQHKSSIFDRYKVKEVRIK